MSRRRARDGRGMPYIMILLIAVAVSFPAGWLVCRAWLKAQGEPTGDGLAREEHHALLQAQRSRYRGQVQRIVEVVRRHEGARDKLVAKLSEVGDRLANSQRSNAQLRTRLKATMEELQKLRSADVPVDNDARASADTVERLRAERAELIDRLNQLEEQASEADASRARAADAEQRAERGELREKLAAAEHRRHELETRLADRDTRIEELEESVESWKHRVIPLTRQVQNYRETVRKLQKGEPSAMPDQDLPADALQQIKGIGPALERRLNAQGIRRFEQIAALQPVELADLADRLAISPNLPERDKWTEQARDLSEAESKPTAKA